MYALGGNEIYMKNQITNLITKLISILAIMLMLVNSSLMLVISVAVDAVQKIIDESKISAVYELNMEKYVNYNVGDRRGVLVQTYLKTGIEYQEGQEYVPIETSNINITVPKVNDKYPESVEVVTKSTKATNGDGNGKDVNYAYNKDNGELTITTENKADGKGNFYTENVAGARDEYQLDFYYDENCYNGENAKRTLDFSGKVELKLKDDRDIRKTQDISQKFEVAENVSGLVSADVTTSDIYNGYINANIQNNSTYRTEYTENVKIQTSYKEIADEITVNSKNFLVNNKNKDIETQDIIYKSTNVNKNEILDILGQDGYLQIIDKDGNVLATINKDTKADDNGNIQVGYEGEKTELNFKFSKPVKLGDIKIQNTKEIKETMKDANVTKVEIRNTVSCVNNVTEKTKVVDEETKEEKEVENTKQVEVYNYVGTSATEIKEAKTDVKVTANNTNWTNNVQNDVIFTATLVTSGPEYNLFKNPVIDIKLPKEVEKVVLSEASILYDNVLKLENIQVVDENGSKIIRAKISGTQTSYIKNEVVNGANIVIPASIILKKDITSTEEKVEYAFANYRNAKNAEKGNADIFVNVTSVVNNEISNEQNNESNENASSETVANNASATEQATENTQIPVVQASTIDLNKISIDYKATLANNDLADGASVHENEYIKYVAKVKNNTGEDVKDLNVIASVPEGTTYVTIITKELTEEEQETTKYDECTITEFPEQKEYSLNIDLKKDEEKEISFYVKVSELTGGNSKNIASVIKAKSGENEKEYKTLNNIVNQGQVSVTLKGWETLRGVNIWRFVITVTNNTNSTLNDIDVNLYKNGKFTFSAENTTENVTEENDSWKVKVDSLGAGQERTIPIFLKARTSSEKNDQADMFASADVDNNKYYSNPNIQFIKNPSFTITQTSATEGEKIKYGDTVEYVFTIKNNTWLPYLCPIVLKDYMGNNMTPVSAEYENYKEVNGEYEKETLTKDISIQYSDDDGADAKFEVYIPAGKTSTIKIKATPIIVDKEEEASNYGVLSYEYNDTKFSFTTNVIKNTIVPYNNSQPDPDNPDPDNPDPDKPDPDNPDPDNPDPDKPDPDNPDPDNPDTPDKPDNPSANKYNISGLVWKDENKNGIRESAEQLLSGITVKLFNIDTNEIVVIDNNKQLLTTNENGEYTFSNIGKGNYIVLFEYDTEKYKLTSYKSTSATDDTNSDVINKTASIDGTEKEVGVTDTISVTTQNKEHIDMGLIENGTYDLSLNKYITNVKVSYGSQEENYDYNNSKLAKVEIPAKKVNNAKVTIEYKIEVKNEGNVDALIDSIVDYKPDGLGFDKSLNKDWNIDNNNLTNVTMLGSKLKPGETRSVTLYLTKTLSKDSMGTFTNGAEILKSSNLLNLKDVDSREGNKDKTEDDYSEAQLVISVKTGAVLYAGIALGVMLLVAGIIALVKTKKLKINKIKGIALSVFVAFSLTIVLLGQSTYAVNCTYSLKSNLATLLPEKKLTKFSDFISKKERTYYTYNYYHHGLKGNAELRGQKKLYCSEGGNMGNYEEGNIWQYKRDDSLTQYEKKTAEGSEYYIYNGGTPTVSISTVPSKAVEVISKNGQIAVGPFKATYTGTATLYNEDGKGGGVSAYGEFNNGTSGRITDAVCINEHGFEISPKSGEEFYVRFSIKDNVSKLTRVQFGSKAGWQTAQNYGVIKHESWLVVTEEEDPQTLKNNIKYSYGESDAPAWLRETKSGYKYANASIWPNVTLPGSLLIKKKDSSTGKALAGAKFQIKGPSGTFNKTTDKDGKIKLENLKPGKYTVTETATASGYYLNWQATTSKNVNIAVGATTTAEFSNTQYGKLEIKKVDADTGALLGGAKFEITYPDKHTSTVTTEAGKSKVLEKLPLGKYKIKEVSAPANYNLDLQENKETEIEITASDGSKSQTYVKSNKQYGNLKVVKKDKDSNSTSLGNIKLSGVQFKLYVMKDGQKRYLSNVNKTKYSYGDFSVTESNKASAKTFTTDDNAQFTVNNLPVYNGSSKITYYVQEYALPDSLAEFYDVKTTGEGVTISNGQTQSKDFLNEQKYVDLSGYVWEDVAASKQTTRNDVYDNREKRIPGITVRLKKNDTVIKTATTDQNGKYKFQKVDKTELKNYYVEFEYNGLKYQSVAYKNQDNGSRAIEGSTARTSFNNSFASITGGSEKGNSTTGYSRDTSGTVTNQLTYSNGQYKSALVGNTGYTASSATNSVSSRNGSSGATIKASTHASGYSLAQWSAGVTEIGNINLGIYLRDQPDMAIATDLDAIDLEMNGYNHTYKYNRRFANTGLDIFSEIQKWNNSQDDLKYPRTYTRKIYKDYIYASAVDGDGKLNEKDKLQVYLTYKIVIKNESSLYMSANEVSNYFDKTLDYSSSYYVDSNGNKVNVNWTSNGDKNGYSQRRTTGLKDVRIAPGSSLTVYLKMKKNTVLSWADKDAIEENAYSISEITSYSTYTKNQNNYAHYAGIDKDSAPDNIRPGSQNTYEDDTDSAPVVKITFDEPRTISGYVFEDKTSSDSLQTNNERKGNGKYESNTDGYVENVKVELVKKDGGKAYIYPQAVKNSSFNAKVAEYTTTKDGKGYYEFVGVIPGEYYIKYTYPNGTTKIYTPQGQEKATVTTQDYKSTIVTSAELKAAFGGNNYNVAANPRWYQSQNIKGYSSALDDYTKRTNTINSELSTITGIKKTNYENSEYSQYNNIRNMTARTPNMTVAIENVNNEVTNLDENRTRVYNNIDFGIVERPRQSLALKKDISYIKLTLATGEVVVEGDPRDVRDKGAKMNYVTYPKNGILKIEADNEIIQGAILEIGYTINIANNSEKDYNTAEYYRYGTIKSGDKPVELTVNTVVDYVDQNLPSTYTNNASNGNWYLATDQQIKNLTINDAYNDIKARKNTLLNDCNKSLAINANTDLTQVKLSKILSTSEDLSFSNYAEAVKVSNPVGRFYGGIKDGKWINMTPGSLQISTKDKITATHELDDNSNSNEAKLAVVPSTGDSTIVYYILGITCLGIIVCGIVLIKKWVL